MGATHVFTAFVLAIWQPGLERESVDSIVERLERHGATVVRDTVDPTEPVIAVDMSRNPDAVQFLPEVATLQTVRSLPMRTGGRCTVGACWCCRA